MSSKFSAFGVGEGWILLWSRERLLFSVFSYVVCLSSLGNQTKKASQSQGSRAASNGLSPCGTKAW